jgi:hypothetical protein
MKHILDPEFRYRPSFDTDLRETFEKARRDQHKDRKVDPSPERRLRVVKLECPRR